MTNNLMDMVVVGFILKAQRIDGDGSATILFALSGEIRSYFDML